MDHSTGVGVLDKMDLILGCLEPEALSLADLSATTGLPRPTAYRLACALEKLRYLRRDDQGRFALGPRLAELASSGGEDWLVGAALPILTSLRDATSESAQLYRRRGNSRLCVAAVERETGLRDSVPAGTLLPMTAGSAAQVLLAWSSPEEIADACQEARFTPADLATVRRRGWAHSAAEREPGLASISAPVFGPSDIVQAVISISGPLDRIGRKPGGNSAKVVVSAAERLTQLAAQRPIRKVV